MENNCYHIVTITSDNPYFSMASMSDHNPFKRILPEHRLIMAQHLGRCLARSEIVHHINGNKSDNRIENLELFQSRKEHKQRHPTNNPPHDYPMFSDMPVITIHIESKAKEALTQEADKRGLSLTTYCRMLLMESLNR